MRITKIVLTLTALTCVVALLVIGSSHAGGQDSTIPISGSLSGTVVFYNMDFDNDGGLTGTGNSALSTAAGKQNFGGEFTTQFIEEGDGHQGTGCPVSNLTTTVASCQIDGGNNGCLFDIVGGAGAFRFNSDGDILSFQSTGGTDCIDFNVTGGFPGAPPYHTAVTNEISFTGGSGKFDGVTGSAAITANGHILAVDGGGHSISWDTGTYTGTLTKP